MPSARPPGAGVVIDALRNQDDPGRAEVEGGAADGALQVACARAERMVHCCCKAEEKLPLRNADNAATAALRSVSTAAKRWISKEATSSAQTPAQVSRRNWCCMSSESGRVPTMTLLSLSPRQQ